MDFKKAFHEGMAKAEDAVIQEKEINLITSELSRQILAGTEGRTDVEFGVNEISFVDASTGIKVKIASWETNNGAFPCSIRYGNLYVTVHDKQSLTPALCDLLGSADSGFAYKELERKTLFRTLASS